MSGPLRAGLVLAHRYTLVRRLGAGSMGAVWLAEDPAGHQVACKVLHPQHRVGPKIVQQLGKEAEVLNRLSHPNITRPIEFCSDGDFVFLAMELVEGQPLSAHMKAQRDGRAPWASSWIRSAFDQLCAAVAHAHDQRVIHRDLKPQNIMVANRNDGPVVKVLDFGLARLIESSGFDETTFGRPMGSLFYMSPEQTEGRPASEQSDVFALGTIMFELVTLRRAWAWDERQQPIPAFVEPVPQGPNLPAAVFSRLRTADRPRVRNYQPQFPAPFDELIARAMSINPDARPNSVDELRRSVGEILLPLHDEEFKETPSAPARLEPQIASTGVYTEGDDSPTNRLVDARPTQVLDPPLPGSIRRATRPPTATYAADPPAAMPNAKAPTHEGDLAPPQQDRVTRQALGRSALMSGPRPLLMRPEFWLVAVVVAALVGTALGLLLFRSAIPVVIAPTNP